MLEEEEKKPHVQRRSVNRVSSAVWPLNAQRVVATGRAAQRRRDWIIQGHRRASAFPLRVLLVLTALLVVASSLLVALLGLRFWFLLPAPLLLFTAVLTLPLFLARKAPSQIPSSLPDPVQEPRTGLLSPRPQEVHSHPGFQREPKSKPDLLAPQTPATPMPVGQPLVRVLETYDLRQPHARRHCAPGSPDQHSWQTTATESLDEQHTVPEDPAGR